MAKEEKPIFLRILVITGIILLMNIAVFFYNYGFTGGFTGFSIAETIQKSYTEISFFSKIFLVAQWSLLILLLFFVFLKDKGIKSRKKELLGIDLEKISVKSKTDLDSLYKILQDKKQLRVSTISKIFNIKKDIAMDWCKTLESGNLAEIDYPGIGEPVIKIISK